VQVIARFAILATAGYPSGLFNPGSAGDAYAFMLATDQYPPCPAYEPNF